jgi:hypothetical protein
MRKTMLAAIALLMTMGILTRLNRSTKTVEEPRPRVSCREIREAMVLEVSLAEVAHSLRVSKSRVRNCDRRYAWRMRFAVACDSNKPPVLPAIGSP